MQKNKLRIFAISISILILLSMMSSTVFAASTTKLLSTNFTLVNFSSSANASGTIRYVTDKGVDWPGVSSANLSFNIDPNSQQQFRQYFDTTMQAGSGSVVVNSSGELGSVVQILARGQTPSSGAYSGFTDTDTSNKFYFPNVSRRGATANGTANSQIVIQNIDTSATINVTVELNPTTGYSGSFTKTITGLLPSTSFYYDLDGETNLPANWFGSAVVTASGSNKITAVSNLFVGPDALQSYDGFPQEKIGTTWVVPFVSARLTNGQSGVITVQNISGADFAANSVNVDCIRDPNSAVQQNFTVKNPSVIANKASYSFNALSNTTFPTNWYGSCKVTAPGNSVTYVQIRFVGVANNNGAAAYNAIPAGESKTTFFAPLMGKRLANGFATAVVIQNLDYSNGATVNLTYTPSKTECPVALCDISHNGTVGPEDAVNVNNLAIGAGGSIQRNLRLAGGANSETALPDGWVGSLKVTSTGTPRPIDGFVQITNINSTVGDTFMAHNAFAQ